MSWEEIYKSKLCTADEAVQLIKDGDHVFTGHVPSEPPELYRALVRNKERFHGVILHHMNSYNEYGYCTAENAPHFRYEGFYAGTSTRDSVTNGYGSIIPCGFSDLAHGLSMGHYPVDVCMVRVTRPNSEGYVRIVCEAGYTYNATKAAKIVLAQVVDSAPSVFGDTAFHVSEIDRFVEYDEPMMRLPLSPPYGWLQQKIGEYCASIIDDGSTLQLGVGKLPDAVLAALKDHKHLGLHTEQIADGVVDLYKRGVMDNSLKGLDNGKMIGTFVVGQQEDLYNFVHLNPAVEIRSASYTNDPRTIAQMHKMCSINACIQIDIMGQVVSDCIGMRQYSGIGGQVDFVRGANMALDGAGKAILLMPSVNVRKDGSKVSKICPFIDHGAAVTLPRYETNYVITEYGIAQLRGKSLHARGEELIKIAHPDFKVDLCKAFYELYRVMPKV